MKMRKHWQMILLGVIFVMVLHVMMMTSSGPDREFPSVELAVSFSFRNHGVENAAQTIKTQNANASDIEPHKILFLVSKQNVDMNHVRENSFDTSLSRKLLNRITHEVRMKHRERNTRMSNTGETFLPGVINGSNIGYSTSYVSDIFLAVFVSSAAAHFRHRETIRHTWAAQPPGGVRVFFVVGRSSNSSTNVRIRKEKDEHSDIIAVDILDSYANLTYKTLEILKWVSRECPSVKYVVKSDDDTFVNLDNLVHDLTEVEHSYFIMGNIIAGAQPMRKISDKWYTPPDKYSAKTYPDYVSGSAYVISGDLVPDLYRACREMSVFWIEDVFITGMCAKKANATLIHNAKFKIDLETQGLPKGKRLRKLLTLHRIPPHMMNSLALP